VVRLKKRTSEGGGRGLPGAQAKGKTRSGGVGGGVRSAHGEVEKRDVGANVCVLLPLLLFSFLYCLFFYGFFFELGKKKKEKTGVEPPEVNRTARRYTRREVRVSSPRGRKCGTNGSLQRVDCLPFFTFLLFFFFPLFFVGLAKTGRESLLPTKESPN
jgi:hypothetical protein